MGLWGYSVVYFGKNNSNCPQKNQFLATKCVLCTNAPRKCMVNTVCTTLMPKWSYKWL